MVILLIVIGALCIGLFIGMGSVAQRRLSHLRAALPALYTKAITECPVSPLLITEKCEGQCLMPLAVDLIRKENGVIAFDKLTENEQRAALYALAVVEMPHLLLSVAMLFAPAADKALMQKLHLVNTSDPQHKPLQFGVRPRAVR